MSGTLGNIDALVMFLLDDLLVVRDVSWISHQFIDDSELVAGRGRLVCLEMEDRSVGRLGGDWINRLYLA